MRTCWGCGTSLEGTHFNRQRCVPCAAAWHAHHKHRYRLNSASPTPAPVVVEWDDDDDSVCPDCDGDMFHPACGLSECIEWAQELMAEQADTDSILFPPEVEMLPLPTPLRGMRHWKNERATILLRNIAAGYGIREAVFISGITLMTYYNCGSSILSSRSASMRYW